MRLIATLLLTVLCFGLSAADFTAADLTAIADKAKTMKVGEASSIKVMVDGKAVYVGLVMGASGLTVAGEGVAAGTYKFLYTDSGLMVQSTQSGQTKTVAVVDGRVQPAVSSVSRAFGAGAVSTWAAVKSERLAEAAKADEANSSILGRRIRSASHVIHVSHDLNSLEYLIDYSFSYLPRPVFRVPMVVRDQVVQTNSNTQAIITSNASGAQPN